MIGMARNKIILVDSSSEWTHSFYQEKALLEVLLSNKVISIEHIGSTAISGIKAKPMIDLVAGVDSMDSVSHWDKKVLAAENYFHLGKVEIEGKEVFAKFSDLETLTKTHVVHVVEYKGRWWNDHLFFRDYLNGNSQAAKDYERLKENLAERFPADEKAYAEHKKAFVEHILSKRA